MRDSVPFQPLHDRLAGLPIDDTLHDGVPDWLDKPLREWLKRALHSDESLARRVAIRLRWRLTTPARTYAGMLVHCNTTQLLNAIDAVLWLHPGWAWTTDPWASGLRYGTEEWMADLLTDLIQILTDGASRYTVDLDGHCLIVRVDPTVTEAVDTAITTTGSTAADHLRAAWVTAYGLAPDPDKVFHESIRAVEAVACPLVHPKMAANGSATLGTVIGELGKTAAHKWELVLPGKDGAPRDVAPLVAMMELLWQAQRSRHAGAPVSRRQDQQEAEAAVHLAALLVHWLSIGVLRHTP